MENQTPEKVEPVAAAPVAKAKKSRMSNRTKNRLMFGVVLAAAVLFAYNGGYLQKAGTKAKEAMLERTHIAEAPWWIVEAVDKKRARLNCISHLLGQIPYAPVVHEPVVLPPRVRNPDYIRGPVPEEMYVPDRY